MKTLLDIYNMAQKGSVRVASYDLEGLESASVMSKNGNCGIAIDPLLLASDQDEKVKLCHELGHCVLGAFYNLHSSLDIREKHEYRANRWAFETLVPYAELMEAAKGGRTEPWELAEHFEVPEDFMRNAIQYYQSIK